VFLGTPDFALPSLEAVAARARLQVVVVQPDRPVGRGLEVAAPPVKTRALELGVPVLQNEKPNQPGTIAALKALRPDLFVVVAYGAILSRELLAVPKLGAINLHASILPELRGASPIQHALLEGRKETGNSTMWMAEGLDTGDVIFTRALAVDPNETAGELSARLAADGAQLLAETLEAVARGDAPRTKQDDARATLTKKIKKSDGVLDFALSAKAVHDRARAMTPWPGAVASFGGKPVRFERTRIADAGGPAGAAPNVAPGTILGEAEGGALRVACGEGAIDVLLVRPAGKSTMEAQSWWRGTRADVASQPRFERAQTEEKS
jgi:methionyl-tRNA formyltransferase